MRKFVVTCAVALAGFVGVASAAVNQTTVNSTDPGVLGKTLRVQHVDENSARLTIESKSGKRESIVVLGGDVRAALYVTGTK